MKKITPFLVTLSLFFLGCPSLEETKNELQGHLNSLREIRGLISNDISFGGCASLREAWEILAAALTQIDSAEVQATSILDHIKEEPTRAEVIDLARLASETYHAVTTQLTQALQRFHAAHTDAALTQPKARKTTYYLEWLARAYYGEVLYQTLAILSTIEEAYDLDIRSDLPKNLAELKNIAAQAEHRSQYLQFANDLWRAFVDAGWNRDIAEPMGNFIYIQEQRLKTVIEELVEELE